MLDNLSASSKAGVVKVAFVGLARDCAHHIETLVDALDRFRVAGLLVHAFVGENGSSDGTRELLIQNADRGISFIDTDFLAAYDNRLDRMARGRERLAREVPRFSPDFVVVVDFDEPFLQALDGRSLMQSIQRLSDRNIFAVAATSRPTYYDLLAYESDGLRFSYLPELIRTLESRPLQYLRLFYRQIYPAQDNLTSSKEILCYSAFNGVAIYAIEDYLIGSYLGGRVGAECEHVVFNRSIRSTRGGYVVIDPALELPTPIEHARRSIYGFVVQRLLKLARGRGFRRTTKKSYEVAIVQELLAQYRVEFYERLHSTLGEYDVKLRLLHGKARGERAARNDEASIVWAETVKNRIFHFNTKQHLVWQSVYWRTRSSDLIVAEQANKHVVNFLFMLTRPRHFALWGHGGDLQGCNGSVGERIKRFYSRLPTWWFAYTEGSARRVVALGYPRQRVSVVNNAVSSLAPSPEVTRRPHRCVYVGGLHRDKKIGYLTEVIYSLASLDPKVEVVIAGDGPEKEYLKQAVENQANVTLLPPQFGQAKADLLASGSLIVMPGLIGLIAVDSFNYGTPIVTIESGNHSPEYEYLNEKNALILQRNVTPTEYAESVVSLLEDGHRLQQLREGAISEGTRVNLEQMVANFSAGILRALGREYHGDEVR